MSEFATIPPMPTIVARIPIANRDAETIHWSDNRVTVHTGADKLAGRKPSHSDPTPDEMDKE